MLIRLLPVALLAGALVIAPASAALADDPWIYTDCEDGQSPTCTTSAGTSKQKPGKSGRAREGSARPAGGPRVCKDMAGTVLSCSNPDFGEWEDSSSCYLRPASPAEAQVAPFEEAGEGPGGWFQATCFGYQGTGGALVWRPTAEGTGAPAPPPPVVIARRAVDMLELTSPVIGASPSPEAEQLVQLPTWLWVQPGSWAQQSATASVPGVSVTATATPTKVTWSMGDGNSVVCRGPGTPFSAGGDPRAESPTCGHTYRQSSAGQPDSAFAVTATMSWSITWAGGGQEGGLPALETTSETAFRVAESQALVGTGAGSG